jgi:hypothetical protein
MNVTRRIGLSLGGVATSLALLGSGLATASAPANAAAPEGASTATQGAMVRSGVDARCFSRCWGAVAVANHGAAWGSWKNAPTKARAKRQAVRQCRGISDFPRTCHWQVATLNSCGATAVRMRQGWVVRYGRAGAKPTKHRAQRRALHRCQSDGRSCIRRGWVCTANRF